MTDFDRLSDSVKRLNAAIAAMGELDAEVADKIQFKAKAKKPEKKSLEDVGVAEENDGRPVQQRKDFWRHAQGERIGFGVDMILHGRDRGIYSPDEAEVLIDALKDLKPPELPDCPDCGSADRLWITRGHRYFCDACVEYVDPEGTP